MLAPVSLDLGGKTPVVLSGSFDANGYSMQLSGTAVLSRLVALGKAVPAVWGRLATGAAGEAIGGAGSDRPDSYAAMGWGAGVGGWDG